jgi:SSS family solute:Na+ symporter
MSLIDWIILYVTLLFIVLYGIWKSRNTKNISGFLLADKKLPWYHVGLSVMATQASAITFLSAPGQGYSDGLRFIQFYFGLPLAMVLLCITFIPIFQRLNVYTAYEYLERRFDGKTRSLTAALFLFQRGLSTGVTIYAPAIILSTILEIEITYTIILNGVLVILYTVYGGTKAVSHTQLFQMCIIFGGLFLAAYHVVHLLPQDVSLADALHLAGKMDRLNAIDTTFDLNNRYNVWSGLIGGFFLQLSYFGTDQSQVGRYLTGSSITQSRLGLIMNGLVKIPMQFLILMIGVMVFCFYQFYEPPVFFNKTEIEKIEKSPYKEEYHNLEAKLHGNFLRKKEAAEQLVSIEDKKTGSAQLRTKLHAAQEEQKQIKEEIVRLIKKNDAKADVNDSNFVFLSFVTTHLPKGVVGLLIAIIFLAAMGSTASGLNSLASTTVVDFYKKYRPDETEHRYLSVSRWSTLGWGVFCIIAAFFASRLGNLIEAVNILGSLFYGTILGIFLVAFYLKKIKSQAVFYGALFSQILVTIAWCMNVTAFLWLNVAGCLLVIFSSSVLQLFVSNKSNLNENP